MVDGEPGDGTRKGDDCPVGMFCQSSGECACPGIYLCHIHMYYNTPD